MVVNAAQLGTYSQAKQFLLATGMVHVCVCYVYIIIKHTHMPVHIQCKLYRVF